MIINDDLKETKCYKCGTYVTNFYKNSFIKTCLCFTTSNNYSYVMYDNFNHEKIVQIKILFSKTILIYYYVDMQKIDLIDCNSHLVITSLNTSTFNTNKIQNIINLL